MATATTDKTEKRPPNPLVIIPAAVIAFIAIMYAAVGLPMLLDAMQAERQCYSAWDEAFHPRWQDGRCSILQLGLRVPSPYDGDYVKPPQPRD